MKNMIFLNRLPSLLLSMTLILTLSVDVGAQGSAFEHLGDESGTFSEAQQSSIESYSQQIRALLPPAYQSLFKVYGMGYYIQTENFSNSDYDSYMDAELQYIQSQSVFYLFVAWFSNARNTNHSVKMAANLPTDNGFECFTDGITRRKLSFLESFLEGNPIPMNDYDDALLELKDYMEEVRNCCVGGQLTPGCLTDAPSGLEMGRTLMNEGYVKYEGGAPSYSPKTYSGNINSSYQILFESRSGKTNYTDELNDFVGQAGGSADVVIYNDSTASTFDWSHDPGGGYYEHIVIVDKGGGLGIYVKTYAPEGPALVNSGSESANAVFWLAPWAMKKLAVAGGVSATSALAQISLAVLIEKCIGGHATWGAAWDAVDINWWGVIANAGLDGAFSAIGMSSVAVQIGADLLTSLTDYLISNYHTGYNWEDMGWNFVISIAGTLMGKKMELALERISRSLNNLSTQQIIDMANRLKEYSVVKRALASSQSIIQRFNFSSSKVKNFLCKIHLGDGCFVKDTPVLMAGNANQFSLRNKGKALALAATIPIVAVPIQDVQLLDYAVAHKTVNSTYGLTASTDDDIYLGLLGNDPYTSDQQRERDEYQLDDENWNEVVFEEVLGGSIAKLALHNDWINQKGYQVDAVVQMNLPEQGINGPFKITSIKHIIPQKKPLDEDEADDYDYRPVTALFTHESNQVYNIDFDNGESLGVTYQHPIFSTTANDWKLAGELEIGEEVLTKSGNTKVVSSTKKEGSETVYNLEVKELHNFLVGESGVVVHNSCFPDDPWKFFNIAKSKWHDLKDDMIKTYKKFTNSNGEKWPYFLGDNPDVGFSEKGTLMFKNVEKGTPNYGKTWDTLEDASIWIE